MECLSGPTTGIDEMTKPEPWRPFPPAKRRLLAALAIPFVLHGGIAHAQSESVIDILVVYTSAAREEAGGKDAMEAEIDLMVTETNTAFRDSGANPRLRLVHVQELDYAETPDSYDLARLYVPGDGHMDEVHALRNTAGADLVHLIEKWGLRGRFPYCGRAALGGSYGVTVLECGSLTFAHEIGHNFGLLHDRYEDCRYGCPDRYAYGYLNQAMFDDGAPPSSQWRTIMSYSTQCEGRSPCKWLNRFSNPDQALDGDPLGVPVDPPTPGVYGPADARRKLNEERESVAERQRRPSSPAVLSLKRRQPAVERTNANTLLWRLAFNMDVQNVTSGDFELAGEGLGTPALSVAPKSGSQRIYDITATGGNLDNLNATVTLGFASGQDITALDDTKLTTTWPPAVQRSYALDNTAPQPTIIAPSTAGSSPFTATVRFDEDVKGFDGAGDVTATNATVAAPSRSDARTYTVQVTPATAGVVTVTVPESAAEDGLGNGNATASGQIAYDPTLAKSLTVSGLADAEVSENEGWTSASPPSVSGDPAGTVTWIKEGADTDRFTIDAATGVLRMAAQDFESPADANADNAYEVTVRAVDANGNAGSLAVTVTVTDAVERINGQSIGISGGLEVWENIGFREIAYLAKKPIGEATWTLTGDDVAHFTSSERYIFGNKYYVLEMPMQDFEAPADANADNHYEVTLAATDADGNRVTRALTVRVVDRKDVPGVTVNPTRLGVTEGARAAYTVVLDSRPAANVTLTPTSGAPGKATVAPASHTFTRTNWSTEKTFTVTGVAVGSSTIGHAVTASTDGGYPTSLTIESVDVTVTAPPPPPPPPPPNRAPVADAGEDVEADPGATVTLDGSGSTDPDGDALSLAWSQTSGESVALQGADTATPSFEAPAAPGALTFRLTVSDAGGLSASDTVTVKVTGAVGAVHRVPFLQTATHPHRVGVVRIINRSAEAGEVSIAAFDDAGAEHGPRRLRIGANATVHFTSTGLDADNPDKGLSRKVGEGKGDWRLELATELDIEALSYVRTRGGGALASMHEVVPEDEAGHRVVFFNPASNRGRVSWLRLINPGEAAAAVRIEGVDDAGKAGESAVELTLAGGASRALSARALESGEDEGLAGALGDGAGKWRLRVTADQPIRVMSLLSSGPHLTNVSTAPASGAQVHHVPLLPPASHPHRDGVVRVINRSAQGGEVAIAAFDDAGVEYGPLTLRIGANTAVHFNSADLEAGNPDKGLESRAGAGEGAWRLELASALDLEVLPYARARGGGALASLHEVVPEDEAGHRVVFFNPASNRGRVSWLRLINPGEDEAAVRISGVDDAGEAGESAVELTLAAGESRSLSARVLESGEGEGLAGALGDGAGKWRLRVTADHPIRVMSLLSSGPHLTNVSTAPGDLDRARRRLTAEKLGQ